MAHSWRLISSVILAAGLLLVLLGFVAALGFTPAGALASVVAIGALLYAGAMWSRAAPTPALPAPVPIVVFDHECRAVTGPSAGTPLPMQYPEMLRPEIERRCKAALTGASARFFCLQNGRPIVFDALPVRNADGAVVYGLLLAAESASRALGALDDGHRRAW